MTSPTRVVAVLEHDDTLRESICRALGAEGLAAAPFADGRAAAEAFERDLPDLAVLQSDAPAVEGLDLCRHVRERAPALPIIVTVRDDQLNGGSFDHGADDYLPRPFSINELLTRVKALLRRATLTGTEVLAWEERPLTLGPLTVEPLRLRALWNGQDLGLTVTEFLILHALVRRAGVVKTRDQLMQEAYPGRGAADRLIDHQVSRLRGRFERQDAAFDALEGVHNAGFRYRAGPSTRRG